MQHVLAGHQGDQQEADELALVQVTRVERPSHLAQLVPDAQRLGVQGGGAAGDAGVPGRFSLTDVDIAPHHSAMGRVTGAAAKSAMDSAAASRGEPAADARAPSASSRAPKACPRSPVAGTSSGQTSERRVRAAARDHDGQLEPQLRPRLDRPRRPGPVGIHAVKDVQPDQMGQES